MKDLFKEEKNDGYKYFVISNSGDFPDWCRSSMALQSKLGVLSKWLFWLIAADHLAVVPYGAYLGLRVTEVVNVFQKQNRAAPDIFAAKSSRQVSRSKFIFSSKSRLTRDFFFLVCVQRHIEYSQIPSEVAPIARQIGLPDPPDQSGHLLHRATIRPA
jgi:hypothetical protein